MTSVSGSSISHVENFDKNIKSLFRIIQEISNTCNNDNTRFSTCSAKFCANYLKANNPPFFMDLFYGVYQRHRLHFVTPIYQNDNFNDEWLTNETSNDVSENIGKKKKGFSISVPKGVVIFLDPREPKLMTYSIPLTEIYLQACKNFDQCRKKDSVCDLPPRFLFYVFSCMRYAVSHIESNCTDLPFIDENIKSLEMMMLSQPQENPNKTGSGMNILNNLINTVREKTNFDPQNISKSLEGVLGKDFSSKLSKGMEILQRNVGENPSGIESIAQGIAKTFTDPELKETMGDVLSKANGLISSMTGSTVGDTKTIDPADQE
jgi:hypothetical protein